MARMARIFMLGGEMLNGRIIDSTICAFADAINGHNVLQTAEPTLLRIYAFFVSLPIPFPFKLATTSASAFVFPATVLSRGSAFHPTVSD